MHETTGTPATYRVQKSNVAATVMARPPCHTTGCASCRKHTHWSAGSSCDLKFLLGSIARSIRVNTLYDGDVNLED